MLKQYFEKAGGFSFFKQLIRNHLCVYSVCLFILLPKTRQGLELFRECIKIKLFNKLKKKYMKQIRNSDYEISTSIKPGKVWFCWLQGIENAPELVRACYASIKKYLPEYELIEINSNNFCTYTNISEVILNKWKKGIITNTHFSDILRNDLLMRNGGLWIDSTVLFTSNIPKDISMSDFFLFETLKPGKDGKAIPISSWFISSVPKHPILMLTNDLLNEYWKKNNSLCDYFLYHNLLKLSMDYYSYLIEDMPKYTNETPHLMLFELKKAYDKSVYESICQKTFCHKLTNKLSEEDKQTDNTFYSHIIKGI